MSVLLLQKNREFEDFKQKLIVMATFSNRVDVITVSNQYNQIYAHHHGYVRIVSNNRILPNSPAPWEKIPMISQLLANLSVGVVFWIDDDAFVKKSEIKVQDWLDRYAGADLIIGNQDAIDQKQFSINSGVMIIKNTKWSRSFFNSLMKNPNCNYISRSCCWEQDCMRKVLSLPNKHVALVPLGKFNCWGHHKNYAGRCDPWVYHVMGQGIDKASEMKILAQSINTLEKRSPKNKLFQIHILTMNRFHSLRRLLTSLENSIYNGDRVELHIHIDKSEKSKECTKVAQSFQFSHGLVNITVSKIRLGLRDAWLNAWNVDENERAIILEDDIELSVNWYLWLQKAWNAYEYRTDLAGISLQRQTLIPKKNTKQKVILNNNIPFLYKLVGSIGFSPHPTQWKGFLSWIKSKNLDTYDANVDGLITSDWYKMLDKKSMWTQLFIKYCNLKSLYTLYVTLPGQKTLAAHWREKGEHYQGPAHQDFELANTITWEFPKEPVKYDWDGESIKYEKKDSLVTNGSLSKDTSAITKALRIQKKSIVSSPTVRQESIKHSHSVLSFASNIHSKYNVVAVQFLNEGFVEMTKSWICNVKKFPSVLAMTLFIVTDTRAHAALKNFGNQFDINIVFKPYSTPKNMAYGNYAYYDYMLFRTNIISRLLQNHINVWLIESDAVWLRDPSSVVLNQKADIITMSDAMPPKKLLQGGFQFLRSTDKTIRAWKRNQSIKVFKNHLAESGNTKMGDISGSEQLLF